jgi:hypothetical protein
MRRRGKGGHCPRCKASVPVGGETLGQQHPAPSQQPTPRRSRRPSGSSTPPEPD